METNSKFVNIYNLNIDLVLVQLHNFKSILTDDLPESIRVCYAISRLVLKVYTKQQPSSLARKFESVHVSFKTQLC